MNYRWYFMGFLWLSFLSIVVFVCLIIHIMNASIYLPEEQRISDLEKYGIHTQGVLVEELTGTPNALHFRGNYEAEGMTYDFILSDMDKILSLNNTVTIIYNIRNPRDHIIKGYYINREGNYNRTLGKWIAWLIFTMLFAIISLYKYKTSR